MWLLRCLRVVAVLTPFVPARVGYAMCSLSGMLFFAGNLRARRNIMANIQQVDPKMRWIRREITALRVCITVVTNYYDLIRLRSIDRDTVTERVDVRGLEHVEQALERGCGAIIVSGHIGNFSVMARLPAVLGFRAALVAERVEPPALFNYMARLRSAMGIQVIPPGPGSLRSIIHLLKCNGVLLLAADRDVTQQGQRVQLFGRETRLPAGPVVIAMRSGAALIPAWTHRDTIDRSSVTIGPSLDLQLTGDWNRDLEANLRKVAGELERMIANDPGQWAVLQRVWPPTTVYGRSEGMGSADDTVGSDLGQGTEKRKVTHAR